MPDRLRRSSLGVAALLVLHLLPLDVVGLLESWIVSMLCWVITAGSGSVVRRVRLMELLLLWMVVIVLRFFMTLIIELVLVKWLLMTTWSLESDAWIVPLIAPLSVISWAAVAVLQSWLHPIATLGWTRLIKLRMALTALLLSRNNLR